MRKQVYKHQILMMLILLMSISVFGQVKIEKSNKIVTFEGKKYYSHKIEKGQTLYSISKAYNTNIKEIAKANQKYSIELTLGESIRIPYVENKDNNQPDYLWHRVAAKETLFSLAQEFEISVNDIIAHNPDVRYALNIGQLLKIPNVKKGNINYQNNDFYFHIVEKKETLFSLAQEYGTTIEQINLFNPETKKGINEGQTLKIPKRNYNSTERLPVAHKNGPDSKDYSYDALYFEENGVTPCSQFTYKPGMTFNVALMLPLNLNLNSLSSIETGNEKRFYKNTQRFFEMYEGALLALQQLKIEGVSVNLHVFDTQNNPEIVRGFIEKNELKDMDLIIGPIYSENVKAMSDYVKKQRVNLVMPLSQNDELLEDNPFIFQVMPSNEMKVEKTCDYFSGLYDSSIVIIHNNTEDEKKIIDTYRQKLVKSFSSNNKVDEVTLKVLQYSILGASGLEDALSIGVENVIVIPSDNEVFVTKLLVRLNELSKKYKIKILGHPNWEMFESIEYNQIKNLSLHFASPTYIDYENWRVKSFIRKYRETYQTEPGIYSYQGYDIMFYFISAMKEHGKNFQFCMSPYDNAPSPKGLSLFFDFGRTGLKNGFENNGIFILKYNENMKLTKTD